MCVKDVMLYISLYLFIKAGRILLHENGEADPIETNPPLPPIKSISIYKGQIPQEPLDLPPDKRQEPPEPPPENLPPDKTPEADILCLLENGRVYKVRADFFLNEADSIGADIFIHCMYAFSIYLKSNYFRNLGSKKENVFGI